MVGRGVNPDELDVSHAETIRRERVGVVFQGEK